MTFKCPKCNKPFNSEHKLMDHIAEWHPEVLRRIQERLDKRRR